MEEAKFQWFRSLPDGVIIVVRGEDIVTFMLDVRAMQKEFHLLQGETTPTANPTPSGGVQGQSEPTREPVEEHFCHIPEHNNAPLKQGVSKTKFNKDGTPKKYWYHFIDDEMCFGQIKE